MKILSPHFARFSRFLFLIFFFPLTHVNAQPLSEEEIDTDIIRFLTQATFGATPKTYSDLRERISNDGSNRLDVYESWIDEQIALPPSNLDLFCTKVTTTITTDQRRSGFRDAPDCYWTTFTFGKDQLRQRMAFSLSQILVISSKHPTIRSAYRGVFSYWDTLANHAFGNYSDLLYDVTLHPIMGIWLSHISNPKAVPNLGIFPDENYAREVMQLFSMGLVQRRLDGSVILDADNNPIPTYNNSVIEGMARVLTGLSYSRWYDADGNEIENTNFNRSLRPRFSIGQFQWLTPMKVFSSQHDYDEKILFTDKGITLTIPAANEQTEQTALDEIRTVINALTAHSSTAPTISRLLIQRLVTSNPSPEYIERVATAFASNGDMTSAIKAILLDPEARDPSQINSDRFGKLKEPVLLFTNLFRLLDVKSGIFLDNRDVGIDTPNADNFDEGATLLRSGSLANTGQEIMAAPSVFNFYSPNFSPGGILSDEGIVSPESQLQTDIQMINLFNLYHRFINFGINRTISVNEQEFLIPPFTVEKHDTRWNPQILASIWDDTLGDDVAKTEALVDFLDFYLNAGYLKIHASNSVTRSAIIELVTSVTEQNRYRALLNGITGAPEIQVQR